MERDRNVGTPAFWTRVLNLDGFEVVDQRHEQRERPGAPRGFSPQSAHGGCVSVLRAICTQPPLLLRRTNSTTSRTRSPVDQNPEDRQIVGQLEQRACRDFRVVPQKSVSRRPPGCSPSMPARVQRTSATRRTAGGSAFLNGHWHSQLVGSSPRNNLRPMGSGCLSELASTTTPC